MLKVRRPKIKVTDELPDCFGEYHAPTETIIIAQIGEHLEEKMLTSTLFHEILHHYFHVNRKKSYKVHIQRLLTICMSALSYWMTDTGEESCVEALENFCRVIDWSEYDDS